MGSLERGVGFRPKRESRAGRHPGRGGHRQDAPGFRVDAVGAASGNPRGARRMFRRGGKSTLRAHRRLAADARNRGGTGGAGGAVEA
ncbi:MAG: hypothetical protein PGMFKBFP_02952 [Anaerolineales bacterium]|nr:hypothetical protein [Anaerolineales bacterium]